jgi:hypothetical protein
MSDVSIKIHKTVETDGTYVPSFTLKLSVITADGVSPCIFVHEYTPSSKYTEGGMKFTNVAYYDELSSVNDYVKLKRKQCLVRKSELTKSFATMDMLNEFLATVSNDIQRLLQQIETTSYTGECEDLTFTSDGVFSATAECLNREPVADIESEDPQPAADTIILSFDGK